MKATIWPVTDGDKIFDLRNVIALNGTALVPALIQVDQNGKEVSGARLIEFNDGGGHLEAKGNQITEAVTGLTPDPRGLLRIDP